MLVYSHQILRFIEKIKREAKQILANEVGLKVGRERFWDEQHRFSYPLRIVIFNHGKMLGYFDPNFFELGFHERLRHASQDTLLQIIRHELAHYLTFIQHGNTVLPHGPEFKACCKTRGWGEEVFRATICLDETTEPGEQEGSATLRKVQKLMALGASSNPNEAQAAMMKSQQLLMKHNLDAPLSSHHDEEQVFLKRILKQKKITAKMRCIGQILETFFVNIVYSRSREAIFLEILGTAVNVEIAEYVAKVLEAELDRLWKGAQRENGLKGSLARNSFFLGIAKGYCNKVHALKREYAKNIEEGLIVIEQKLTAAKAMAYPHLSTSKSKMGLCKTSSQLGEKIGKTLTLSQAIGNTIKKGAKLFLIKN